MAHSEELVSTEAARELRSMIFTVGYAGVFEEMQHDYAAAGAALDYSRDISQIGTPYDEAIMLAQSQAIMRADLLRKRAAHLLLATGKQLGYSEDEILLELEKIDAASRL